MQKKVSYLTYLGQKGISWEHMWQYHGISDNRTLHEDEGTGVEKTVGFNTLAMKTLKGI